LHFGDDIVCGAADADLLAAAEAQTLVIVRPAARPQRLLDLLDLLDPLDLIDPIDLIDPLDPIDLSALAAPHDRARRSPALDQYSPHLRSARRALCE